MAAKSKQDEFLDKFVRDSEKNLPAGTKGVAAGQSGQAMTPEERQKQTDDIKKSLAGG